MRFFLWRCGRREEDLDEEIRSHLQMALRERIERGETAEQAEHSVRREFGNVDLVKEITRDMWGRASFERLVRDVGYGLRTLRKSPGFAFVTVLTLALGIGANTAMFSVINAVVLRPLPFPQSDKLMSVSEVVTRESGPVVGSVSYPDFFDWRTQNHVFQYLSVYRDTNLAFVGGGRSQQLPGAVVSHEFFSTMGIQPVLGRGFRLDEEKAGANVVVLSNELWRSQFNGDPNVVGSKVTLGGRSFTVIGVMPPHFRFPIRFPTVQLWVTVAEDAVTDSPDDPPITGQRGVHLLQAIGKLQPEVAVAKAQAEMNVIAQRLAREYPDSNGRRGAVKLVPQLEKLVGDTTRPFLVLFSAVAFVLLIACANIANLLLARGAGRNREIAVRSALGASPGRIVRQFMTESLVLSFIGAMAGVPVAHGAVALVVRLSPWEVRGLDQVSIDGPVLGFAAVVAVLAAVVFGIIPAFQAARTELTSGLKEAVRATAGRRQHRLRAALVVSETALGVVLLVGAGLLLRGFERLLETDPGFDPHNVATLRFSLPNSKYPYSKQIQFYDELLPSIGALYGVEAAAAVAPLPLSGHLITSFEQQGQPAAPSGRPSANIAIVSPGYFHAMRIPLRSGREFTSHENGSVPHVIIVNECFARQYFPHEDPIGRRIKPGLRTIEKETPWREIVGVVGDVKQEDLGSEIKPAYFIPYSQGLITSMNIVVRTAGNPANVVEQVRRTVTAKDPELALYDVRTMDEYLSLSVAGPRFRTLLLSLFAGLGLLLTAVGLYGVMAYTVSERTREFGLRRVLGAGTSEVMGTVLRNGFVLVGTGLLLGSAASVLVVRQAAKALPDLGTLDARTFLWVGATLLLVALLACYVPARRATRVNVTDALRQD